MDSATTLKAATGDLNSKQQQGESQSVPTQSIRNMMGLTALLETTNPGTNHSAVRDSHELHFDAGLPLPSAIEDVLVEKERCVVVVPSLDPG
jgi:hypothetical protein